MDKTRRGFQLLWSAIAQDLFHTSLGQLFTKKPIDLELFVNETCDSQCTMSNIWQLQKNKEVSLASLQVILKDPLFVDISHVNITGGEPLLRADIFDICKTLITSFPKLTSIQILTNAINPKIVIEKCVNLAKISKDSNIIFSIIVSIGGIGEDHDRNRVVAGNFAPAIEYINSLKHNELPISIRCTLTPMNCFEADDVLVWCQQNDVNNWQFQPAVDMKNYCHESYTQEYQFTTEQRFHLIMFFDKLARLPGLELSHRFYYRNLVAQLSSKYPLKNSCILQTRVITLNLRGEICFCSPEGSPIRPLDEKNYLGIYKKGIPNRRRIIKNYCRNYQNDSFGGVTTKQLLNRFIEITKSKTRRNVSITSRSLKSSSSIKPAKHNLPKDWQRVLITGWYGTETTGDKAILGELLHFIKERSPQCEIVLTTINKNISEQTNLELKDLENVNLVNIFDGHKPALIDSVDAVIMGGGPLMETRAMESIWRIFSEANRQGKARIIFGCGIGPLHTDYMSQVTAQILQLSTAGFFRDKESYELSKNLAPGSKFGFACDPALGFLKRWVGTRNASNSNKNPEIVIATLLRANTREFFIDLPKKGLEDINVQTAGKIAGALENFYTSHDGRTKLLAMNAPWIGGDDRLFNRLVASSASRPELFQVAREYYPIDNVIQSLISSDLAIAMRYHGHLFSMALGIPFLSIDYTGKSGKVFNLVNRIGYSQWSESWRDLDVGRASKKLNSLIDERNYWSTYLIQESEKLVVQLQNIYSEIFDNPK